MNGDKKPPIKTPAFAPPDLESEVAAGADEFWRYCLSVYERAGVAPACLSLQDDHGADVNMLLLCCWRARDRRGRRARRWAGSLDIDHCRALLAAVAAWRRGAVEPLRRARRHVGLQVKPCARHAAPTVPGIADLAKEIAACELLSERVEQRLLVAALPAFGAVTGDDGGGQPRDPARMPRDLARANIMTYIRAAGLNLSDHGRAQVELLLAAVFANSR